MREILCFGDSNTWGYDPVTQGRFPGDVRWTGVLQAALGPGFRVIEEGLNGRTTVWEDPVEGDKMGKRHLPPCLESQAPLDLVVLMLGTNDTKERYSAPPADIAAGVGVL
ncbi:MAG: GDSL-type esterase/lipase family protein, partial [Spirochaetia bacterium]